MPRDEKYIEVLRLPVRLDAGTAGRWGPSGPGPGAARTRRAPSRAAGTRGCQPGSRPSGARGALNRVFIIRDGKKRRSTKTKVHKAFRISFHI